VDSERGLLLGFPLPAGGWKYVLSVLSVVLVVAQAGCSGQSGKESGRPPSNQVNVSGDGVPAGAGMQVPAGIPGPLDRAEEARRVAAREDVEAARLVPFLRDPDPLVRGTVAGLLFLRRDVLPGALLPGLEEACGDLEELRLLRAELGARDGEPSAGREACRMAEDEPDPAIRSRAARACVLAGHPAGGWLQRLAEDRDWRVRTRLAVALRQRCERGDLPPEGREVLDKLAADPHPTVATAAAGSGTGRGT